MRILHTSDWHVGRNLHRQDMADAHALYFDHLAELVQSEAIDAILIAGDVFDRAVPSLQSIDLLQEALSRLTKLTQIVLTPGNHDSTQRLGFLSEYLNGPLYVCSSVHPQALQLENRDGSDRIVVYGLPYLDPDEYRFKLSDDPDTPLARRHHTVMNAAMNWIRSDVRQFEGKYRTFVMAHAFVTGADPSDSERDIAVGGVDNVGASLFDGFDYIALGHLHRPQQIQNRAMYYCGSPVPFSFSEANDQKRSLIVDTQNMTVESIPAPIWRPLARFESSLSDIENGKFDKHRNSFCEILITDFPRPNNIYQRVKARFPYLLSLLRPTIDVTTTTLSAPRIDLDSRRLIREFLLQSGLTTITPEQDRILDTCLADARKCGY